MRLQQLVVILFSFLALAAAQPHCDPVTEYEQDRRCCRLCSPGTSMTSPGNCLQPQCQDCRDGDYQDKHTKESKCLPQPYCDPNKNFQLPVHDSMKQTVCMCKEGFHCSSSECITCVPHRTCKPGHGVKEEGNHGRDTVCEKCSEGTFSQSNSRTEACQKWTECPSGRDVLHPGTDTSDRICGGQTRTRAAVIGVAVTLFVLVLLLLGFLIIVKHRWSDRQVKACIELCTGEKKDVAKENPLLVANPSEAAGEPPLPQHQLSWDEPRTPEEVDDDLSQEISITAEIQFTDKGNCVMQDRGMKEMKSEEEA